MKNILILLFVFCVASCEGFFNETLTQSIYGLDKPDRDTERFVSRDTLSDLLSTEYYLIRAFFQEDKANLKLFSHFHGVDLEDGIQIQLERTEDRLRVKISVWAYPSRILFDRKGYFLNNGEVDLTLGVENGTNYGFRVRIWENFLNRKAVVKIPISVLTEENLLVDSFAEGFTFYNKGHGLKWGIKLFRVRLEEGARVSPRLL